MLAPVVKLLRGHGVILLVYLDDWLIIVGSPVEAANAAEAVVALLELLGFYSISERRRASTAIDRAMAFSLYNHCPCRLLRRVHTRLTTAPRISAQHAQALQVSLRLKLPVLSYILLKCKFIRQASRQCQRALDPHTD